MDNSNLYSVEFDPDTKLFDLVIWKTDKSGSYGFLVRSFMTKDEAQFAKFMSLSLTKVPLE